MRLSTLLLLTTLCCGAALAQATAPAPPVLPQSPQAQGADQRIERIRLEDDGTVIEELRVGGQAQSISVQPKAAMPGYEILPEGSSRSRSLSRDGISSAPGQRVWNVLKF